MYPTELARICGMDPTRLKRVVFGHPPQYRVERSPFALGFIVRAETPEGPLYVITPSGLEEARSLMRAGPLRRGVRS